MDIIREEHKSSLAKSHDGVPTPADINAVLDEYVIGQARAKRASVAVHNHYKRLANAGRTVCRDFQVQHFAGGTNRLWQNIACPDSSAPFDVPFTMADATTLTEAGYVGEMLKISLNCCRRLITTWSVHSAVLSH